MESSDKVNGHLVKVNEPKVVETSVKVKEHTAEVKEFEVMEL